MQKVFSYTTSWRPEYYYFTINQDVILHVVSFFVSPNFVISQTGEHPQED